MLIEALVFCAIFGVAIWFMFYILGRPLERSKIDEAVSLSFNDNSVAVWSVKTIVTTKMLPIVSKETLMNNAAKVIRGLDIEPILQRHGPIMWAREHDMFLCAFDVMVWPNYMRWVAYNMCGERPVFSSRQIRRKRRIAVDTSM